MRNFRYLFVALVAPAMMVAADPTLLRMVMPDAKVVAGIHVEQAKSSPFGKFLLSRMQVDDPGLKSFVSQTGFDPRRDVSEILIASNWQSATPEGRWLVMGRGTFDLGKIAQAAQANGATILDHQGVTVYQNSQKQQPNAPGGLAFLDPSTAVMGDLDSVKAAIDRERSNTPPSAKLLDKIGDLSSQNDFWFATLVPLAEFSGAIADPNLNSAMKGNLLAGILEASGGIRLGDTLAVHAETVARSEKDAQALVDVVKFMAGMVQMNRQNNPAAEQAASLIDNLDCKATGTHTTLALAIPESVLEQLVSGAAKDHPAKKKAAPPAN